MSYRSFKRVLGETSLERKCRFLFGACLLFLITGSFWWYGSRTEDLVYQKSTNAGQRIIDGLIRQHAWEKFETDPGVRELVKSYNENYLWHFIKPDALQSGEQLDVADKEALAYFLPLPAAISESNPFPPEYSKTVRLGDQGEIYYQTLHWRQARKSCLTCHHTHHEYPAVLGKTDIDQEPWKEGDLMAVVKVEIPDADTQKALNLNRAILLATAIITVFLAMIASYIIVRYVIVKPLKRLHNVSDAISHGNTELRAEIHTADEFEELGTSFNRMLRHLVAAQEELRKVNGNLDGKVDELAQANMRLYELNRLKSDFLATMSHELRTPLNSIIGFSEVLDSIKSLDDKQRRYVQNIQKSGRVLLDMINDILDLAKIESGKMEVRLSEFRIDDVISAHCDMARPQTENKNIDLDIDVAIGLPELYQDQGKVQQILQNLLSNAIKFTPEGGRIVVSAGNDERGDCLLLTVTDTGVGIADEDQVAIFEKFRQGRAVLSPGDAITREYSGTGLGLSIVKELCKLLGGEITLHSVLGKGSAFTVRLPWSRPHQLS